MGAEACPKSLDTVSHIEQLTDSKPDCQGNARLYEKERPPNPDGGPPVRVMHEFIDDWLKDYPDLNMEVPTRPRRGREQGARHLHTVVAAAIEIVWVQVKMRCAWQPQRRKAKELHDQTKAALRSMDRGNLTKIIDYGLKDITSWLQTDSAGSLQAWKSFDLLVPSTPEQRDAEF